MGRRSIHMDQIDAAMEGDRWLESLIKLCSAERIERTDHGNGATVSLWRGNDLLAYYVIIRDLQNWSVLVMHDLSGPLDWVRRS